MSLPQQQQAFFATQIDQQSKQIKLDQYNKQQQDHQQQQNINKQQHVNQPIIIGQQSLPIQQNSLQQQLPQQIQLKHLLQLFNSYDKKQKGTISLQQCHQLLYQLQHINKPNKQQLSIYFNLTLPSNNDSITFDQFLFIYGLCQFDIQNKSIDQQYQYCKKTDHNLIDFLRLLNNYRKKCQKQSIYQEAKKSKNKVQQVRSNQYQRRKNLLNLIHQKQLQGLQDKQKQKFIQFCQTWDQFMNQYQHTASQLIKKLNQKQQQELKQFIEKTKQDLSLKIRFSKKIVQLQDLQKKLVKSQEYQKAQKIKTQIESLKIIEIHKKQKQDLSTVQLRAQTVRKQHAAAMNTLLQKIQKDRNDQSKQRMSDSQKLIVKSKTLVTEVKHRHNQSLKKLYQSLHNVAIDEARITSNNQIGAGRSRSSYNQSIKQKV